MVDIMSNRRRDKGGGGVHGYAGHRSIDGSFFTKSGSVQAATVIGLSPYWKSVILGMRR